jgi:transposase-like protein
MKNTRRKFSASFKAQVSLAAIKEQETLEEISKRFEIHPTQIGKWKREFLTNASVAFEKKKQDDSSEEKMGSLYQKIGVLEVENDFLKKTLRKTGL